MWFWLREDYFPPPTWGQFTNSNISFLCANLFIICLHDYGYRVSFHCVCVYVFYLDSDHSFWMLCSQWLWTQIVQSLACIIQIRSDRLDNCIMPPVLDKSQFNFSISHMHTLYSLFIPFNKFPAPSPSVYSFFFSFKWCAIYIKCSMCLMIKVSFDWKHQSKQIK